MNLSKISILIIILVAIGTLTFVINYTKQPLLEARIVGEIRKIKDEIKTEAKGEIIKYQEESFYQDDDFSAILENEDEFKSQLIEKFKKEIIGVEALNCKVDLNQSKKSAILKCDIKGAMYAPNQYNMHFLLGIWNLDLWDDFKPHRPPYGKKLTYEGKIDGVPTKIVFEFPYELSHCHEHVWPK